MADRVGQQLGNYRIIRSLGGGAFADVYLGEHRYLKSYAALKVLRTSLKDKDVDKFLSEAQTLVRLAHPNIVRVLEFAVDRGTPVLIMDYALGGTLRQHHPRGSCLSLATTVSYVKQIGAALQYAHNRNIIHRDVKPENILLGSEEQVLLSDVGIALLSSSPEMLGTQSMAGTLPYSAPEQLRGKPSFASDQYSLGIVTYEWLCGKRPFEGTRWEIFNQHLSVAPAPLRETCPELPAEVEAVVLRALAKDPRGRFASVQAFAYALERTAQESDPDLTNDITAKLQQRVRPHSLSSPDQTVQRIFLSASPTDDAFAARLKADLEKRDILVWHSTSETTVDALNQEDAARQGIRAARVALVVLSSHTRSSRLVKEHLRIASMYERQLVFVWSEGDDIVAVLPEEWGKTAAIDLVDAREMHYEQALDKIIASLAEKTAPTTPLVLSSGEPRNPYKGLSAFTRDDAVDFFGRETLIQELMETMQGFLASARPRLLALLGSSGSGKSSIVMAGLLPWLQKGDLLRSTDWVYLEPMVPGTRPLECLAITLALHFPGRSLKSLSEDLENDAGRGLYLLTSQLVKRAGARVVLVIDQFEELFTQTITEEERRHFIDQLVTAVTEPRSPVIIILTLRADFYDRPLAYPELGRLIQRRHHVVLPMELQDLRAVIEQPAALPDVQLTFEGNLVGDLLFETQGQAGALPLLEFTLDQLFQQRDGRWLTQQAYQQIGGVKGALAKHAESTYASLPTEEHRQLARALFLRLIDPGITEQDTTRRRAALSELSLPDREQTTIMREAANMFVAARLLTTNTVAGTTTIEVSHEALIREWARLTEWLREARADITVQQIISADAAEWARRDKPADRVYRGSELDEAQAWSKRNLPSTEEVAFLQASASVRQQQQEAELHQKERELNLQRRVANRQRLLVVTLSIFSVVVIVLASVAELGRQNAITQQQIATSRAFAAQANSALAKNQLDKALLLSLKANQTNNTFDARDSLLSALEYNPHLLSMLQAGSPVSQVVFRPDSQTFVSFGSDGEVTFWDVKTRKGHTLHLDFRGGINAIPNWALSPDGKLVAGASDQGLWLWDSKTGATVAQLEPANQGSASSLSDITPIVFSPDGNLLASARCAQYNAGQCTQGRTLLWDVAARKSQSLFSGDSLVMQLVFSPDGKTLLSSSKTLAVGKAQGSLQLWDIALRQVRTPSFAGFTKVIVNFILSPDGKRLAASDGNAVYLWDVASQKALGSPFAIQGIQCLALSPDGKTLAAGCIDKTVRVWDVTSGIPSDISLTLRGHQGNVTSLAFSPDGKTFVSSDDNRAILLWNIATENSAIMQKLPYTDPVFSAIFSPDGRMIVAGNNKGQVILQNVTTESPLATLDATLNPTSQEKDTFNDTPLTVESLAFSPDRRILAAGRFDGTIFLWDTGTKQLITHFHTEKHLRNIVFNADNHLLAASYDTGSILLLDVATGHTLQRLMHPTLNSDRASTIAFSPDGKMLACGNTTTVIFWDTVTGKQVGQALTGHQAIVKSVVFSPDGHRLASIDSHSNIIIWDIGTMKALGQPFLNADPDVPNELFIQTGLAFSPDGMRLAAGGYQSVTVWDVTDVTKPERLAQSFRILVNDPMSPYAFMRGVAFSPDGQQVVIISYTFTQNYAVSLWEIDQKSWQAQACSIANHNFTLSEWKRFVGEDVTYQKVCSNLPIDGTVIEYDLKQAHADVQAGRKQDAQALYMQATQEATQLDDGDLANAVCFDGSTDQFAREVLSACEQAVSLNRYDGQYHDSRGVARVLTGNSQSAIDDFTFYVQWATEKYVNRPGVKTDRQVLYKQHVAERMLWIQQLQAGQNPFDTKTLQALRIESSADQ